MTLTPAKCTQCGADIQVDTTKDAGVCEFCGTAFVTEKVINNYNIQNHINVASATINISGGDIANLLLRAEQYEQSGDFEKAREYYNRILDIDANHEIAKEKIFGQSLRSYYIGSIKVTKETINTIEECLKQGQKLNAIKEVRIVTGMDLAEAKDFIENYYAIDTSKPQTVPIISQQAATPRQQQTTHTSNTRETSGGCYVATCVYGSYDCPQVWTLRRFRDDTLSKTWYGRTFICMYYAISPTIVKWFGECTWFRKMWKTRLDRMIVKLQAEGIENTPYQDRKWN